MTEEQSWQEFAALNPEGAARILAEETKFAHRKRERANSTEWYSNSCGGEYAVVFDQNGTCIRDDRPYNR